MRLKECAEELISLLSEEHLKDVPMLVYANKQDLQFALDADAVMESLELAKIKERTWNIQACSAFTKEGLSDGMEWLIKTISAKQGKWLVRNQSRYRDLVLPIFV